jgi:glycosyltransferase involved in cell wall biosynthesis
MFCSVIIPTIARSSLDRAVNSVLDQTFTADNYEVVVVNDSGKSLPQADWCKSEKVRIIHTNKRERNFARNSGAAVARGTYLCFLDDDDWLLPNALQSAWELVAQDRKPAWIYGGIRIVDDAGRSLAEMNSGLSGDCFAQIMGGSWAPIQSSFIQTAAFFEVGGYKPYILGTEDLDLCRRISLYGEFANTGDAIACLHRGASWRTSTNYDRAESDTKRSRDEILSEPGVFKRLLTSADSSYWHGRILRVYLSTLSWNLKKRNFAKATSRGLYSLLSFIFSIRYVLLSSYWDGVKAHHLPDTLHFVMQELEKEGM